MSGPFDTVLVANRGEIARRIIHACRERGLRALAVYAEADAEAPFVREADEAVALAGTSAADTYLNVPALLEAAARGGAQAVHPGYGFLSERADFAQAVVDAGLVWVGPPPEAIRRMGDKARARALAQGAGVPTVPGAAEGEGVDLLEQARRLGFPVLLKASAGGGGKGMRVVAAEAAWADALEAVRREARAAFGDDRLIVETYVENPRHIEVQVLADAHGGVVHLFERECSIQRRHQKVVEESPAPGLSARARAAACEAAVALARAAGYENAGTVEFIFDERENFYFLEMNTRLQVEHPVTEAVTGLDLVALQLAIAAGGRLPLAQGDVVQHGHAIEVRVYAEDPATGFAPQTGVVEAFRPARGPGVRWDSGIETGSAVTPHFDPLLAKLVVSGADRPAALRRLRHALADTVLLGVHTNLTFLQAVCAHPAFAAGATTTRFLEQHFADWAPEPPALADWLALAAHAVWGGRRTRHAAAPAGRALDPWDLNDDWRNV